jgi:hypothetical protein
VELYRHSPNTSSWRGAQLKHRGKFTFNFALSYFYETWVRTAYHKKNDYQFPEDTMVYPKVSGLSHNEINNDNNNKHSLRSNTKGYGGKTH